MGVESAFQLDFDQFMCATSSHPGNLDSPLGQNRVFPSFSLPEDTLYGAVCAGVWKMLA